MSSDGYGIFDDPYAYPGTSVLRNLLNIQDAKILEAYEVEISTLRAEESLPVGSFDPDHYRSVHRHLFQDVYSWAGEYRTVRIAKGGNAFCYPEYIPEQMEALFNRFDNGKKFANLPAAGFAETVAAFLGDLNAIHPFREGNGRTQLSFLGLIGASFGHPFQFERLDRKVFLSAIIASYLGDLTQLRRELMSLIAP